MGGHTAYLQKKRTLPHERIERLVALRFRWSQCEDWEKRFLELSKYQQENGHCNVPQRYPINPKLGKWVITQRRLRKEGKLSEERRERLDDIGFSWELPRGRPSAPREPSPRFRGALPRRGLDDRHVVAQTIAPTPGLSFEASWEQRFKELLVYKEKEGHCNVPQNYPGNPQLGNWTMTQRARRKEEKLPEDRIARLVALGFRWSQDTDWEKRCSELSKYQQENGRCNVPRRYLDNPQLANWVHKQRKTHRAGKLLEERRERLDEINFSWEATRGRPSAPREPSPVQIVTEDEGCTVGRKGTVSRPAAGKKKSVSSGGKPNRTKKKSAKAASGRKATSRTLRSNTKRKLAHQNPSIGTVIPPSPGPKPGAQSGRARTRALARESEKKRLVQANKCLQKKNKELKDESRDNADKIGILKSQLEEKDRENANLKEENTTLREAPDNLDLVQASKRVQEENKKIQSHVDWLRQKLWSEQEIKNGLKDKLSKAERCRNNDRQEIGILQSKLEERDTEIAKLKEALNEYEQKLDDLERKYQEHGSTARVIIDAAANDVMWLKDRLREKRNRIRNLEQGLGESTMALNYWKLTNTQLERELEEFKKKHQEDRRHARYDRNCAQLKLQTLTRELRSAEAHTRHLESLLHQNTKRKTRSASRSTSILETLLDLEVVD